MTDALDIVSFVTPEESGQNDDNSFNLEEKMSFSISFLQSTLEGKSVFTCGKRHSKDKKTILGKIGSLQKISLVRGWNAYIRMRP